MDRVVGTCGLCGGPVGVPAAWASCGPPPVPRCARCGATQKNPYGPVLDMEPAKVGTLVDGDRLFGGQSPY